MTRTLDCCCEVALMSCACAGYTAGKDLASLRHITAETSDILVINMLDLIYAKAANLFAGLSAAVVWSVCHSDVSPFVRSYNK